VKKGVRKNQATASLVNALLKTNPSFPDRLPSFDCQKPAPTHLLNLFSITPAINSGATGGTKP
jgi:hypothetical protein